MSELEITKVRVNKVKEHKEGVSEKILAMVSVVLNEQVVLNKIRVIQGINGPFPSMHRQKDAKGEWQDVFHPITAEFKKKLDAAIMEEYNKLEK